MWLIGMGIKFRGEGERGKGRKEKGGGLLEGGGERDGVGLKEGVREEKEKWALLEREGSEGKRDYIGRYWVEGGM